MYAGEFSTAYFLSGGLFGSVFVSGQPSSIWLSQARGASRARPSTSEFDISVSSSTSFASSSHQRIPSIELGFHLSRSIHFELGFYFSHSGYRSSSISIYRARVRIELESDAIELGELANSKFSVEGWVEKPLKSIPPVKNFKNK